MFTTCYGADRAAAGLRSGESQGQPGEINRAVEANHTACKCASRFAKSPIDRDADDLELVTRIFGEENLEERDDVEGIVLRHEVKSQFVRQGLCREHRRQATGGCELYFELSDRCRCRSPRMSCRPRARNSSRS